ncbi:MAG: phage holin family protein [Robiginitalea sp.]
MAFDELKKDLSESQRSAKEYIESTAEYYQLKSFKFLMKAIIALTMVLFLGTIGFLMLFFVSIAASIAIGDSLDSDMAGFLVVGVVYCILGIMAYIVRKKLEAPVLKTFSKYYFEDE